jgi:hypothetical protein
MRAWVLAPDLLRFLPLLRREHRVQLLPGSAHDRVELGLDLVSDGPQLATLMLHDRIDSSLLLGAEAKLVGKSVPKLAVPRSMLPRSMLESMSLEFSGQQHPSIDGNSRQSACYSNQEEYQNGEQSSTGTPRCGGAGH